jgi:hypothetical protein
LMSLSSEERAERGRSALSEVMNLR